MAEADMATADVVRLAQELRSYVVENPAVPIVVRAAAGWLVDLAQQRDSALEAVAAAEELADAHRAVQRAIVSGADRNDVDLARGFALRHVAEAVDEWRNRGV